MTSHEYADKYDYLTLCGDITSERADCIGWTVLEKIKQIQELQGLGDLDIRIDIYK